MTHTRRGALALIIAVAAACGKLSIGLSQATREAQVRASLRATLGASTAPSFVTRDREGARLWRHERAFYEQRDHAPAWVKNARPMPEMDSFVSAIQQASAEGLDPELYSATLLAEKLREGSKGFLSKRGFEPGEAGTLEAWLTYLYLKYASDLADGISDLSGADPAWQIKPEPFDAARHLARALQTGRIKESLDELLPKAPQYAALRKLLADYRAIAQRGGWSALPASMRLRPGKHSSTVPLVAARLAASGDFNGQAPSAGGSAPFDESLEAAVRHFQARHGLEADGVVSPPSPRV